MGSKRAYTKETIDIMARFFEVVEMLILLKEIRGVKTYCDLAGINRRHYYTQKDDLNRGYFEISWVLPLIKDFGVSSTWLLLGKGSMFAVKLEQKQCASMA